MQRYKIPRWTPAETAALRERYAACESLPELAATLGRTAKQCSDKARNLGLQRTSKTSEERRQQQLDREQSQDTDGIVRSAKLSRSPLEKAWAATVTAR